MEIIKNYEKLIKIMKNYSENEWKRLKLMKNHKK